MLLLAQHSPKAPAPVSPALRRSVSAEGTLSQLGKHPSQRVPLRRVHSLMTLPPPDSRAGHLSPLQTRLVTNLRSHDSASLSRPRDSSIGGSPGAAESIPGHVRAHSPTMSEAEHLLESPLARDGNSPVTIPFLSDPLEPPPSSSVSPANDSFSPYPARPNALQSPNSVSGESVGKSSFHSTAKSAFDLSRRVRSQSLTITAPDTLANERKDEGNYRPNSCPTRLHPRAMVPRGPRSLATKRPPPLQHDLRPFATEGRPSPLDGATRPFAPTDRLSSSQSSLFPPTDRLSSSQSSLFPPTDRLSSSQSSLFSPRGRLSSSQSSLFSPRVRPPPLQLSPWARSPPSSQNSPLSPVVPPPSQNSPFSRGSDSTSFSETHTPVDLGRLSLSSLPPPVRSHHLEW